MRGPYRHLASAAVGLAAATAALEVNARQAPDAAPARTLAQGPGYAFTATPLADGTYALHEEATSPERQRALGGRSAAAQLTVDCARRQSAISSVRVYPDSGLSGEATQVKPGAWLRAAPVDLFDFTEALCAGPPAAPLPSESAAPSGVASAPVEATPAEPMPAPPAAPAPRLAPGRWVQLGAFATEALAEAEWSKLAQTGAVAAPVHRLEPVRRGEATLFRLLAGPFPSAAAAKEACRTAVAAGAVCLVR